MHFHPTRPRKKRAILSIPDHKCSKICESVYLWSTVKLAACARIPHRFSRMNLSSLSVMSHEMVAHVRLAPFLCVERAGRWWGGGGGVLFFFEDVGLAPVLFFLFFFFPLSFFPLSKPLHNYTRLYWFDFTEWSCQPVSVLWNKTGKCPNGGGSRTQKLKFFLLYTKICYSLFLSQE